MTALALPGRDLGRRLLRLPLTLRVPLVVAGLMVLVSALVSERALSRFEAEQARHVVELGNAYLDGLSPHLVPAVVREDVWEVFDLIDRARGMYRGLDLIGTVVVGIDGRVIAASDPRQVPTGSPFGAIPPADIRQHAAQATVAHLERDLQHRGQNVGTLHASIDTGALKRERDAVLWTLILGNAALTLGLSLLGYIAITRMVRPLRRLSAQLASGTVEPFPAAQIPADPETARLYEGYNRLVAALDSRERLTRRLAEKERLAALGQLASGMAHEINNPLGGLTTALDTLDHYGERAEVRNQIIPLLRRGLEDIGRVVRTTLARHRGDVESRPLTRADVADLRVFVEPDLCLRRQTLDWHVDFEQPVPVPAGPLRQALLNLLLNATNATPEGGRISFSVALSDHNVIAEIEDSGPGLPETLRSYLTETSTDEVPLRGGPHLGLWLVRSLTAEIGGRIEAGTSALGGARIAISVPLRNGGADAG
ncbi:MAG: ATP-binding protein [Pararhodobacter sp.]